MLEPRVYPVNETLHHRPWLRLPRQGSDRLKPYLCWFDLKDRLESVPSVDQVYLNCADAHSVIVELVAAADAEAVDANIRAAIARFNADQLSVAMSLQELASGQPVVG